jgi:hypothetical protein
MSLIEPESRERERERERDVINRARIRGKWKDLDDTSIVRRRYGLVEKRRAIREQYESNMRAMRSMW